MISKNFFSFPLASSDSYLIPGKLKSPIISVIYVSLCITQSDQLCGVPQGSILRPLLFILFINDIVNASKIAEIIMSADDTTLFFKHKELGVLYTTINVELVKISQWFKLNKLSLNIKKTNYIVF